MSTVRSAKSDLSNLEGNAFQVAAIKRVEEILDKHGISTSGFSVNLGAKRALWTAFFFQGEEYVLAAYEDEINMIQGPNLFECFLPEEFKDDSTLLKGFSARLDRLLSGGSWDVYEED